MKPEKQIYIWGQFVKKDNYNSGAKILEVIEKGKEKITLIKDYSIIQILQTLDKIGKAWKNKDYPYRKKTFQFLTCNQKISPKSTENLLDIIPLILNFDSLKKRITMSIPFPFEITDKWLRPFSFPGRIRAFPRGITTHICAGNVFLGALDSLIMGILTKNVNIVKLSSHDPVSLLYFMESLINEDKDGVISSTIAVLNWERGNKDIEDIVLNNSDTILVWGGEDAIKYYKNNADSNVKVIGYGPKISFGIISKNSFIKENFLDIAAKCAHDICLFDQKACSSPQNIFIQSNDESKIKEFMNKLKDSIKAEIIAISSNSGSI